MSIISIIGEEKARFLKKSGEMPDRIYLGHHEIRQVKLWCYDNLQYYSNGMEMVIHGMVIHTVDEPNHLFCA
jgi:hypothetical protein